MPLAVLTCVLFLFALFLGGAGAGGGGWGKCGVECDEVVESSANFNYN